MGYISRLVEKMVKKLHNGREYVSGLNCKGSFLPQHLCLVGLLFIALIGIIFVEPFRRYKEISEIMGEPGRLFDPLNCHASGNLQNRSFPDTFQNLLGPSNQRFGGGWNATSCAAMVGIFSYPTGGHRRALLRSSYNTFFPKNIALRVSDCSLDKILLRFVVGIGEGEVKSDSLELEDATFGDIIFLDMEENMNEGKTYTYFKYVGDRLTEFNYPVVVGKVDDDSFINIPNFLFRLTIAPWNSKSLAFGRNCYSQGYFCGMGYFITQNLVTWISQSSWVANNTIGKEDELFTSWLDYANKNEASVVKPRAIFWDILMHTLPRLGHVNEFSIWDYGWPVTDSSVLTHWLKSDAELKTVINCYFKGSGDKLDDFYKDLD